MLSGRFAVCHTGILLVEIGNYFFMGRAFVFSPEKYAVLKPIKEVKYEKV
jgi:hypothetical protein